MNKNKKFEYPENAAIAVDTVLYAVLRIDDKMEVNGIITQLPKGEFVIPVFVDHAKAVEYSKDKYEILPIRTGHGT